MPLTAGACAGQGVESAYQGIVAGSRRAALAPNEFRDVLQMLERKAIVRLGEFDADAQDMDLDIRALVTSVAGDDFVASLEQESCRVQSRQRPTRTIRRW